MEIKQNVSLKDYTTMHIGGTAKVAVNVTNESELLGALTQVQASGLPLRVIGWGSNLIAHDEGFDGALIVNKILGFEILGRDGDATIIRVGAGESLDSTVQRTVDLSLSGIECLLAIPGTVGAAPVQNAGAYGQEMSEVLEFIEALDRQTMTIVRLLPGDCEFKYRDSIFKHVNGRYVITRVALRLQTRVLEPPFYASLQTYLDEHNITYYTPDTLRAAVTAIRAEKLPNPTLIPNTGSFFKNPIVEEWIVNDLRKTYPDMPAHDMGDDSFKVPAAWLIEQAGLKGHLEGGFQVYPKNALVLTNIDGGSYATLSEIRQHIITSVRDQFRITLEQEPEELI